MKDKQEQRIKRGHMTLMKNSATALYSGVMLMGTSEVLDNVPTAYTDGVNKRYGRKFLEGITEESKVRGLILHENLHVALKHVVFGKKMFEENAKLANIAADFVVNDIIYDIIATINNNSEKLVELPDGAFYDPMFHNWSMREVFNYLKKNCKGKKGKNGNKDGSGGKDGQEGGGNSVPPEDGEVEVNGKTYDTNDSDEHDFSGGGQGDAETIEKDIERALREGGMLAGRMGGNIPRAISELLTPKIDWKTALREFVSSATKGKDEFTWRRMNKRQLANDIYMPSMEDETVGEIIVAIDTSGSIGSAEITEFATELVSICDLVLPERVRVLWWDTAVHGEQLFDSGNYANIAKLLKPKGGGGTAVSCVNEYILKEKLAPECVLVFTDGYLESTIDWSIPSPTLWMVTRNRGFTPPVGKSVYFDNEGE